MSSSALFGLLVAVCVWIWTQHQSSQRIDLIERLIGEAVSRRRASITRPHVLPADESQFRPRPSTSAPAQVHGLKPPARPAAAHWTDDVVDFEESKKSLRQHNDGRTSARQRLARTAERMIQQEFAPEDDDSARSRRSPVSIEPSAPPVAVFAPPPKASDDDMWSFLDQGPMKIDRKK